MKGIVSYIKSSFDEVVNKVTWPKFSELQSSTLLVLVASLIFAVAVAVVDYGWEKALHLLYE